MPIYEYQCHGCHRRVSLFFRSFSQVGEPVCPNCSGTHLTRLISKVTVLKPFAQSLDKGPGMEALSDVNPDDPRAVGDMMRRWKQELGSEAGEEWDEALGMLESGASMNEIEGRLDDAEGSKDEGEDQLGEDLDDDL